MVFDELSTDTPWPERYFCNKTIWPYLVLSWPCYLTSWLRNLIS